MEQSDPYVVIDENGAIRGCVDLVYSPDDGGWYAKEHGFIREDRATRTSSKIYPDRAALIHAIQSGEHLWEPWS